MKIFSIACSKCYKIKEKHLYLRKTLLKMWCHDGKVGLASFVSGILTTVFTSVFVLSFYSLELNSFRNILLCFIGPLGTYALFCVITYFVTNENDFEVF